MPFSRRVWPMVGALAPPRFLPAGFAEGFFALPFEAGFALGFAFPFAFDAGFFGGAAARAKTIVDSSRDANA